mgnify:CR=1 FL=1
MLVQYDPATQSLVRDKRGRCVPCKPGQLGEILGVLDNQTWSKAAAAAAPGGAASDAAAAVARREDSTLVLARDVFRPGDVYIRTGDLMRMDDRGFYYYVDRIGNSIRTVLAISGGTPHRSRLTGRHPSLDKRVSRVEGGGHLVHGGCGGAPAVPRRAGGDRVQRPHRRPRGAAVHGRRRPRARHQRRGRGKPSQDGYARRRARRRR